MQRHGGKKVNDVFREATLSSVFLSWLSGGRESTCNVGDAGSVIGLGRSP